MHERQRYMPCKNFSKVRGYCRPTRFRQGPGSRKFERDKLACRLTGPGKGSPCECTVGYDEFIQGL